MTEHSDGHPVVRWHFIASLLFTLLGADWYLSGKLSELSTDNNRAWEEIKELRQHCK